MSPRRVTIDDLEQLAQSRAHWRVVEISRDHAVIDICACTGERMERVEAEDHAVISYLRTAHPEFDAS